MRNNFWRSLALAGLLLLVPALAGTAQANTQTTGHYNLDYGPWQGVAKALTPYLDAAFTTPQGVLGYDNQGHGNIDVIFYSDPNSATLGYMTAGQNALHLNIVGDQSTAAGYLSQYGSVVAHETAHILYYNKTGLAGRYNLNSGAMKADSWVTEAIAYYVGEVAYPRGARQGRASLGSLLAHYSNNGATRSSWYDSGSRYRDGNPSSLDIVQMEATGYFLANFGGGGGLARLTDALAGNGDFEAALQSAYGRPSGQYGTASGAKENTLYSEYIKYYYGSY
ncbi:MAG: hypothetical protein V1806_15410 [Pseudomonadota bacterium]